MPRSSRMAVPVTSLSLPITRVDVSGPGEPSDSPHWHRPRLGRRPLSISGKRPFRQRDCARGNSPPSTMQAGSRRSRLFRSRSPCPAELDATVTSRKTTTMPPGGAHVVSARVCGCALGKCAAGACPPAVYALYASVLSSFHCFQTEQVRTASFALSRHV